MWPRLPSLIGRDWPRLATQLLPEAEWLAAAATDDDRQMRAGRLLRLLRDYPAVREHLSPLYEIDTDRIARDPHIHELADWSALARMVVCAASGRWINAAFDGHPAGVPPRDGRPRTLRFTLDEYASAEAFKQAQLDIVLDHGQDSAKLRVELQSMHPADADIEPVHQLLTVYREPPLSRTAPDHAEFRVTVRSVSEVTLVALFYHRRRFIQAMLLIVPAVAEENGGLVQSSSVRPLTTACKVREPDLSLVQFGGPGGYQLRLVGTHSYRAELPYNLVELDGIVSRAREGLKSLLRDEQNHGGLADAYVDGIDISEQIHSEALRGLARSGFWFYQSVFRGPKSDDSLRGIGEMLRAYGDRGGQRIQVVSDGLSLPWHLMYLDETFDGSKLSTEKLLGFKYQIDYIPMRPSTAPRFIDDRPDPATEPGILLAVNDDIDRPAEDLHRTLVSDQVDYWRRQAMGPVTVLRDKEDVALALAEPGPNRLVYFYCHLAGSEPADCALIFTGYRALALRDLEIDAPSHLPIPGAPLVVINACDSVALTPALYAGLLPYFIGKGARGVIGTEVTVPALFAAEWARRFFDRMLDGESVGQAIFAVRHQFLTEHRNLLGLLYTPYCEGDTTL
jgi:hypothetical protein